MQEWLPWAMLSLLMLLFGVAPWHKIDPNHEFIFTMLKNIAPPEITERR